MVGGGNRVEVQPSLRNVYGIDKKEGGRKRGNNAGGKRESMFRIGKLSKMNAKVRISCKLCDERINIFIYPLFVSLYLNTRTDSILLS